MNEARLEAALSAFDQANAADPNRIEAEGVEWPKELLYSLQMSNWMERFAPDASEALRLAARCQHIMRWEIPRDAYPRDRVGYLKWRTELKHFHARVAGEILKSVGYDAETIARVQSLLKKERLKHDPETQTLEDVICLVFLENWFADFSKQHDPDKIVDIVAKTWKKMSPAGHEAALAMAGDLPPDALALVKRALAAGESPGEQPPSRPSMPSEDATPPAGDAEKEALPRGPGKTAARREDRPGNKLDFQNRTAVVTGAAKGIGYATAERLLDSGAAVSLWDRDAAALDAAVAALATKGTVQGVVCDAGDWDAVERATAETLTHFGGIDALVANAGIAGVIKPAWEHSLEDWDRLIRIDLSSVFYACKAVVPHMLENSYGRIVVVSSIAGLEGAPNNAAYSAAKAGAIGFTKAIGKELAQTGVIVNCVAPSGIETPMLDDVSGPYLDFVLSKMPIGRLGRAEETAALICWLVSEENSFSAGAVFDNSGGRAVY